MTARIVATMLILAALGCASRPPPPTEPYGASGACEQVCDATGCICVEPAPTQGK